MSDRHARRDPAATAAPGTREAPRRAPGDREPYEGEHPLDHLAIDGRAPLTTHQFDGAQPSLPPRAPVRTMPG
jgi:hypothetical protein